VLVKGSYNDKVSRAEEMLRRNGDRRIMRLIPASIIVVGILLLSWFGRGFQKFFREELGLEGLLIAVSLASLLFTLIICKLFELRPGKVRVGLLLFPLGIWILRHNPEEVVHLIEYGSFSLAALWGMSGARRVERVELIVGSLSLVLGISDELLQGINPERVFDLRDMVINVVGAILPMVLFRVRS
jgi:hypothetical protein